MPNVFCILVPQLPAASLSSYGQIHYQSVPFAEGMFHLDEIEKTFLEPIDFSKIISPVNDCNRLLLGLDTYYIVESRKYR
jgi:hypothetical protein